MASKKPTVAIVMGSKTDWSTLEHTVNTLNEFGVESTVRVMSAHRTPHDATDFAENAAKNGYKVIIGAAGGAAHLCGVGRSPCRYPHRRRARFHNGWGWCLGGRAFLFGVWNRGRV